MKKVLITGVTGFIGKKLAMELIEDYEVHGLVRGDDGDLPIKYHEADLLDYEALKNVVKAVEPHFVIHLAAQTEVEKSFYDPTSFSETNYVGTVNLIEAIHHAEVKNLELFVFSSTMETYGWQDKKDWVAFNEQTPQYPNAPYAVAKLACEYYIQYAARTYGLPYTILRQTNSYGRNDNDFFVVEQFITQMLKNDKEVHFGNREPYRNFLHIDDLLELYKKIIKNVDLCKNEVFCTGPENVIQIEELAYKIADLIGWDGKIYWGKKPERPGEIYYLNSNNDKAKKILGWEPKIDLTSGLITTINEWQKKLKVPSRKQNQKQLPYSSTTPSILP